MKDIYFCLKPLYCTSKLFGQANYKFNENSQRQTILVCRKSKLYNAFLIITIAFSYKILIYKVQSWVNHQQIVLMNILVFMNIFLISSVLFNSLIKNDKMVDILKGLVAIDKNLKENGLNVNYENERKVILQLLFLKSSMLFCYYSFFGIQQKKTGILYVDTFLYFCFFIRKSIHVCIACQVEVFMFLLKNRFDLVRNNLTIKFRNQKYCQSVLKQSAKLYQEINLVARNVNDFYSIPLISLVLLCFLSLTLLCYNLTIIGFNADESFTYIGYVLVHIIVLVFLVQFCSETATSVCNFNRTVTSMKMICVLVQ